MAESLDLDGLDLSDGETTIAKNVRKLKKASKGVVVKTVPAGKLKRPIQKVKVKQPISQRLVIPPHNNPKLPQEIAPPPGSLASFSKSFKKTPTVTQKAVGKSVDQAQVKAVAASKPTPKPEVPPPKPVIEDRPPVKTFPPKNSRFQNTKYGNFKNHPYGPYGYQHSPRNFSRPNFQRRNEPYPIPNQKVPALMDLTVEPLLPPPPPPPLPNKPYTPVSAHPPYTPPVFNQPMYTPPVFPQPSYNQPMFIPPPPPRNPSMFVCYLCHKGHHTNVCPIPIPYIERMRILVTQQLRCVGCLEVNTPTHHCTVPIQCLYCNASNHCAALCPIRT